MCGIVGVGAYAYGAINGSHKSIFQNMLVASSARGIDGTGMFKVSVEGNARTVKRAGDPFNLFKDEQFQRTFWGTLHNQEYNRWLVGHNRWATKGKKNTKNAHPFLYKGVVLVHNGVLRYGTEIKYESFDVDSEAICHAIAESSLVEVWKKITGAFAIAYYDHRDKTFNLARNKERPLWIGYGKESKSVYFASEPGIIEWAVQRNHSKVADLAEVETNVHYKWTLDVEKMEPEKTQLEAFEQKQDYTYTDEKYGYWDVEKQEWVSAIQQAGPSVFNEKGKLILPGDAEYDNIFTPLPKKPNLPVTYSGYPNGGRGMGVPESNVVPFSAGSGDLRTSRLYSSGGSSEKIKDYLQVAEVLNGLRRLSKVDVRYFDYDELTDDKGKVYFIVKASSPLYDDIEFRIRFNDSDGPDGIWENTCGVFMRGTVVSMLVPTTVGLKKGKGNLAYMVGVKGYDDTDKEEEFEFEADALSRYLKANKGKPPYFVEGVD